MISLEHSERGAINVNQRKVFQYSRDTIPGSDLAGNQDLSAVFLTANQHFNEKLSLSGDISYSKRKKTDDYADTSFTPVNPVHLFSDQDQYGASVNLDFAFNDSWQMRLTTTAGHTEAYVLLQNRFNTSENKRAYDLRIAELVANGHLFQLASGPVRAAVGAGYREEEQEALVRYNPLDPFMSGAGNDQAFTSKNAFAELMVPLVGASSATSSAPRLALSLSGRRDSYNRYGAANTYKVGLQWAATSFMQLRSSYGTAFRGPTLEQGDRSNDLVSFGNVDDPQFPGGERRVISLYGVNRQGLTPETAKSWTVGLDLNAEALGGMSAQVNYYDIRYKEKIQGINSDEVTIIYEPAYVDLRILRSDTTTAAFDALAQAILANPGQNLGCNDDYSFVSTPCNEPASNFDSILNVSTRNVALKRVSGVDFSLNQPVKLRDSGLNIGAKLTYYSHSTEQFTRTSVPIEKANRAFNPRHVNAQGSLEWTRGAFGVLGTVNYGGDYRNYTFAPIGPVPSQTTVDLNLRYDTAQMFRNTWLNNVKVSLNVDNLFDKDPPTFLRTLSPTRYYTWYDGANFDAYGCRISFTVRKSW